jgi:hypothetical protein
VLLPDPDGAHITNTDPRLDVPQMQVGLAFANATLLDAHAK